MWEVIEAYGVGGWIVADLHLGVIVRDITGKGAIAYKTERLAEMAALYLNEQRALGNETLSAEASRQSMKERHS